MTWRRMKMHGKADPAIGSAFSMPSISACHLEKAVETFLFAVNRVM